MYITHKQKGDDMYISLDFESEVPIYEQLKNEIIIGIAKKELTPGERLPSVRALASDIGINLHTVNKAYQQLKQDGFLLIHRQRGVIVHPDGPEKADEIYKNQLHETLKPLIAEALCKEIDQEELFAMMTTIFDELGR